MGLNKRLFSGGAPACLTEAVDIFGDSSGVALYSLDYDASDPGSYSGTPVNVDFGVSGKTLFGARFNGSTSYIDLPVNTALTKANDFTWSLWFNLRSTALNDNQTLFANNSTGAPRYFVMFNNTTLGSIRFFGQGSTNRYSAGGLVTAGTWFHLAVTKSSTAGLIVYLNGVAVITEAGETGNYTNGTQANSKNVLGGYYVVNAIQTSLALKGKIDQVRIFSKALSSSEVSTLYNSGNGEIACVHTATTTNNSYPVANTMYYKLDNSAVDETGNSTATEQEMQYRFGKYGQAGLFNGVSNGSEINTNYSTGDTTLTHSFWMNQSGLGHDGFNVPLGAYWDGTTPYHLGYYIWTNATTINWRVFYGGDGGSTSQYVQPSGTITQNQWHHIVATWTDGTGAKLYIDGSLAQSVSSSQTRNKNGINVAIGGFGHNRSGQANFKGLLDTYRYFNSELSASQVTQLYNEKPETDTSNFKAVLYEGNGGTNFVSNVGFEPDLVWVKARDDAHDHVLYDTVRGVGSGKALSSNANYAEGSYDAAYGFLDTFEATGFFAKSGSSVANYTNKNNESYVAWNWKAGGTAVSNTDGGITSSVSANTAAGFSIVSYTATGSTATVGHGLLSKPQLILAKTTNQPYNWVVYAEPITAEYYLSLNSSSAKTDNTAFMNDTEPTSSVFTAGAGNNLNYANTNTIIAYCWHSVAGYSKIGSYTGATSGVTENIGFEPSMVMIKNATQSDPWGIFDNKRPSGTGFRSYLYPSTADDEDVYGGSLSGVTLTSTGFTINNANSNMVNENGETFLYMAFK